MNGNSTNAPRPCPECGAVFTPRAGEGVCPQCLLRAGLPTHAPSTVATPEAAPRPAFVLPEPGREFGGYRLGRILGEGGMGRVYEADHIESGRRVALKVLGHLLDSPEARRRFLREGRIAASINHPNSVYVYGTEEIDGAPTIAMELVPGGTLQDRVKAGGPLPTGEAVDAALQLIAGLQAAQAFGILHRDIKPSNCFVDEDGTIKIGDFGLSISSATRFESTITLAGAFLGTPAFSSPEQVRGEELTVRSDIYAVGVTLYYLLTGRTPFEGENMVRLLAAVLEKPAPSPGRHRSGLPPSLCAAVLNCLEKQPDARFKTYAELREALLPFSSTAPVPAGMGRRLAAGFADMLLFMLLGLGLVLGTGIGFEEMGTTPWQSKRLLLVSVGSTLAYMLYFGVLEGLRGATLGKMLFGLRVLNAQRQPPGIGWATVRALVYVMGPVLPIWTHMGITLGRGGPFDSHTAILASYSYYIILGLLFSTMRRRNGFAAVQDLASGTRVVLRPSQAERPRLPLPEEQEPEASESLPQVGPYHVLHSMASPEGAGWLLAYDMRLLRKVWIRRLPEGTPPLVPHLRQLGRSTRLRWLNGRRHPGECWDAYEAASGLPLLELMGSPQPWDRVRYWLLDLAGELQVAGRDGTMPQRLGMDQVWITADGRAKLLDVPAPGLSEGAAVGEAAEGHDLLCQVAEAALTGQTGAAAKPREEMFRRPLPLHARDWLRQLAAGAGLPVLTAALTGLLGRETRVGRGRRCLLAGGCLMIPVLTLGGLLLSQRMLESWQARHPEFAGLRATLQVLDRVSGAHRPASAPTPESVELYLAGRFESLVTNDAAWQGVYAQSVISKDGRARAREAVRKHAPVAPDVFEKVSRDVEASLAMETPISPMRLMSHPIALHTVLMGTLLIYSGLPSLLGGMFRGGLLMRLLGLAAVRGGGEDASRLRMLWRNGIAWSPVFFALMLPALLMPVWGEPVTVAVLGAMVTGLAAWSCLRRERSLQDRLAGTWLVRR